MQDPPKNWLGKLAFRLVRSDAFERLLLSVIALNAVFLCLQVPFTYPTNSRQCSLLIAKQRGDWNRGLSVRCRCLPREV